MIHNLAPTIEWISNWIEKEGKTTHFSLWRALYDYGAGTSDMNPKLPKPPRETAPSLRYVTGCLGQLAESFTKLEQMEEFVFIVYRSDGDKGINNIYRMSNGRFVMETDKDAFRFITIGYIPPKILTQYQKEISRLAVFTTGQPEVWMRSLLLQKKVSGLVGWEKKVDPTWDVNWCVSYDEFSYSLLLQDEKTKKNHKVTTFKSENMIPAGLKLGLQRALKEEDKKAREQLWKKALDEAVAHILDEQWLVHPVPVHRHISHLIEMITHYLEQIRTIPAESENVSKVFSLFELWWIKERMRNAL